MKEQMQIKSNVPSEVIAWRRYRREIYTKIGYYTGIIAASNKSEEANIKNNIKLSEYNSLEELESDRLKCAEIVDSGKEVPNELIEKVCRALKELES